MDKIDLKNILIFGLTSGKEIADDICKILNIEPGLISIDKFADGELNIKIKNSVRGKNVFLVQSTNYPSENLMELLITIDALKRASAANINAIIPYFGYARQDRKSEGRQPITSKLIADILTTAGINRLITIDLHSSQTQGFFNIPVDDLRMTQELISLVMEIDELKNDYNNNNLVIVAPDHGSIVKARRFANLLNSVPIVIIDKRRTKPNHSEIQFILGNVKNKSAIIVDDIIDTGGTIINAAKAIKKEGAKDIYIVATHAVFSKDSISMIKEVVAKKIIKNVIVANTIKITKEKIFSELKIVSISDLIAEIIKSLILNQSLTELYNKRKKLFLNKN